ncbi:cytochrome b5 reductase 4 isoform X2 [Corythoichthys intestinalis]|nr:cytochrome b5 reductase 4 isoform X2 [Corythoichthys intestinalis]XP_057690241.1 cytochrome b5 reductase 4 isoform X2 [Corythoichthys intestinalis]XP_061788896.1 cytochrome b5 reductase 4-like [Nerophis lumbriciformis]
MLNIPSQSFPAPSSQQRVAQPGQSGRTKVALKPGHSLMDWIRFSKSGKDLTGFRGRLIEVTHEELKKHNSRNDCWTSIRGMVYNVTPYMDYHPGGEDELMKAAGIDGTDLFDQVHRWVNYESMLKECLVGRMATKPTTAIKAINPPPQPVFTPSNQMAPLAVKDSRPRYDWFQTAKTVHLVIYAQRKVPSSGCTVVDLKDGILRVEVLLGKMSYIIHLRLSENVNGNIAVQTAFSVGKIQVTIYKQAEGKWSSFGQPLEFHDTFLGKKDRGLFFRDCILVSKTELNHNTHMFQLQLPSGTVMHVPVGAHLYFKSLIQDVEVVRPYTPVDQGLSVEPNNSSEKNNLFFIIKVYPDGVLTQHLNSLCLGDHVSVSGPQGTFSLRPLRDTTVLYLLAAGTGFTPMSRLIQLALQEITTIRKTLLLFFNRREADILCRKELDELTANDERFQVEHILSEPCESWTGRKGRVDDAVIKDFLSRPEGSKCYVCVCGPTLFTEETIRLVKQQGFIEEEFHAFHG